MENTTENRKENMDQRPSRKSCIGILAHVDAGKTTLSEALLYLSGSIRKAGRVDNRDAFLDNYELERERGITIFSKQARFDWKSLAVTLVDTPGHVDFSAEMERTLQVLDAAVLVVSGADGIQGHTRTLAYLLKRYGIPTFLFINKMDQPGCDRSALLSELKEGLDEGCVDFSDFREGSSEENAGIYEEIAACAIDSEEALDRFLETGRVEDGTIRELIEKRSLFPCYFGSALKLEGVTELLDGLERWLPARTWPEEFGARIYKITRDAQGNRLTWMKITGGSLKVKTTLAGGQAEEIWEEKVNQIRMYSGEKYELAGEAEAGEVCAVTGLTRTHPGEGLGREREGSMPLLQPVLTYQIELPEGCEAAVLLPKLRQLEEEEPQLHIVWNEALQEIHAQVMGEVQTEILRHLIRERFGVEVSFGTGNIVYKETIANTVEGVGHFEPLRHYAEVHLLLEPGEPGSGLTVASACSEDELDRNWQRLVLTHLKEREHPGVLTGAAITDVKITLLSGRSHLKHTEGGDFRQATYRAVRQGLMQADCVLLEPWYDFRLEIPSGLIGRAMTDIERMHGTIRTHEIQQEPGNGAGMAVLEGEAPASEMQDYQKEVAAYSRGNGRLFVTLKGYEPCHNTAEVMERIGYDPARDVDNPADSVFCAHGSGFVVPWDRVPDYMHLPFSRMGEETEDYVPENLSASGMAGNGLPGFPGGENPADGTDSAEGQNGRSRQIVSRKNDGKKEEAWVGTEEIDEILARTYGANRRDKSAPRKDGWNRYRSGRRVYGAEAQTGSAGSGKKPSPRRDRYLLVDGYNIIFAWQELKELAEKNVDAARGLLQDILCNYQGTAGCQVIVVFDAYRVQGHETEVLDYHNIHVVYTKEAETADQYIEKFTHENGAKYDITVATSDGLEQIIIRGQGCRLLSARDLKEEIRLAAERLRGDYLENQRTQKNYLLDSLSEEQKKQLAEMAGRTESEGRADGTKR